MGGEGGGDVKVCAEYFTAGACDEYFTAGARMTDLESLGKLPCGKWDS